MGEPGGHYVKWDAPDTEGQTLPVLTVCSLECELMDSANGAVADGVCVWEAMGSCWSKGTRFSVLRWIHSGI